MTHVYIAGPMRGIAEFNFPAFREAAAKWRAVGFDVTSPAEHDIEGGFDPAGMSGDEDLSTIGFDLTAALLWDLAQVAEADGLILLRGWEQSSGTRAELATAAALGKLVIEDEHGGEPIPARHVLTPLPTTADEVRITGSTGAQKGSKLARFDLIPAGPLTALAEHYGRGAAKYAARNWELGTDWHLNFAAMMRHAWQFWGGEDIDSETGSPHVISVAWHAFALAEFMRTHPELDTRPVRHG